MSGIELVGKIGSMALIERGDIDYNKFARIGRQLRPGTVWVTSGATEIGRLDYKRRTGAELEGDPDEIKTDYAAQGQIVLQRQGKARAHKNHARSFGSAGRDTDSQL